MGTERALSGSLAVMEERWLQRRVVNGGLRGLFCSRVLEIVAL